MKAMELGGTRPPTTWVRSRHANGILAAGFLAASSRIHER